MHSSLLAVFPQGPPTFKPQQVWRSWRQQGESGGPPVGLHLTGADSVPLTGRGPGVGWSWPGQRPARESSPRASLSQGRPKGPPAGSELRCQEGDMREQSLVGRHLLPPMGGVSSSACHAQRQIGGPGLVPGPQAPGLLLSAHGKAGSLQRDFSAILSSRTQGSGRLPAHRRQVCMLWTHPNRLSRSAELVGPRVAFLLLQESPEGLRHLVPTPASGTRPFPATATTAAALTRSTGPARQESRFLREPGHFRGGTTRHDWDSLADRSGLEKTNLPRTY